MKGELHLSPDEFYLYCILNLMEDRSGVIATSIKLITELLPVKYRNTERTNRRILVDSLATLVEKKIIVIHNYDSIPDKVKGLGVNDLIIMEIDDDYIIKNSKVKGYVKVSSYAFQSASSATDLYIHFVVKKWEYRGSFRCSYNDWGEILGVSQRTAVQKIEEAVTNKAIFINVGSYKDRVRQEVNEYKTTEFDDSEKTRTTRKYENKIKDKSESSELPF